MYCVTPRILHVRSRGSRSAETAVPGHYCSRVLYIKGTTRRMNREVRRARFEPGSSWLRMSWAAASQPQIQIKTFTQGCSGAKCRSLSHLPPSNGIQGLTLLVLGPTSLLLLWFNFFALKQQQLWCAGSAWYSRGYVCVTCLRELVEQHLVLHFWHFFLFYAPLYLIRVDMLDIYVKPRLSVYQEGRYKLSRDKSSFQCKAGRYTARHN